MSEFSKGVLASIIGSALLAACTWLGSSLASAQVTATTALNYVVNSSKVDDLVVWDLRFMNNSEYAFDELKIRAPSVSLVASSFEPSSESARDDGSKTHGWDGKLLKGESLRAMFVFSSADMEFTEGRLDEMIEVRYQNRNADTGDIVRAEAPLVYGDAPSVPAIIKRLFWFILPFVGAGALGLFVVVIRRWRTAG